MTPERSTRSERRDRIVAVGRRDWLVAVGLALSGLLLAACPGRRSGADRPAGGGSGGGTYRRY